MTIIVSEKFSIYEQNKILKSKRSNNHLDTSKLESKYDVNNIKLSVYNVLDNMHKNNQDLSIINDKLTTISNKFDNI